MVERFEFFNIINILFIGGIIVKFSKIKNFFKKLFGVANEVKEVVNVIEDVSGKNLTNVDDVIEDIQETCNALQDYNSEFKRAAEMFIDKLHAYYDEMHDGMYDIHKNTSHRVNAVFAKVIKKVLVAYSDQILAINGGVLTSDEVKALELLKKALMNKNTKKELKTAILYIIAESKIK